MELDLVEIELITENNEYKRCIEVSKRNALKCNENGIHKPSKIVDDHIVEFYGSEKIIGGVSNNDKFGKWLTNCYPIRITIDGVIYSSSEHYFQIAKFIITEDDPNVIAWCKEHKVKPATQVANNATLREYLATLNPVAVAKSGRTRHAPIRGDWENIKCAVMYRALMAKFSQNPEFAAKIKETGTRTLIERAPSCGYWAINNRGIGKNMLGILLMIIRSMLE